jgi:hypothetical protein
MNESTVPTPDRLRLREIERRLTADLLETSEKIRFLKIQIEDAETKSAEPADHSIAELRIQHCDAKLAYDRALQRFTDFAAKRIIPQDLSPC